MNSKLRRELEAADVEARRLDDVLNAITGDLAEMICRDTGWDGCADSAMSDLFGKRCMLVVDESEPTR